jgi:transposase
MLIKTILNNQYNFKSFIYSTCRFSVDKSSIEIDVLPRKNSKPLCSICMKERTLYDTRKTRRFEFIPLWGLKVYFCYKMRRVNCITCGIKVENVPWGSGKKTTTNAFSLVLADWAKSLSWKETAERFHVSWQKVFHSVEYVVEWGLRHRDLSNITAIGVDEISYRVGHKYMTLVYQINTGSQRLLWLGKDRTVKTMLRFFHFLGKERNSRIKYVCSDMWKPYLKVIKKKIPRAIHVLDRFHIVQKTNKAIDQVRAEEYRMLAEQKKVPVLKNARWCLLKRPENLTEKQEIKLSEILKYNLKSIRAYLLKEDFDGLWSYVSPSWAGKFIDRWTTRSMRSKIDPMKKIAKMIRRHKPLILNWFVAKGSLSSGVVEGLNNKIKVTMRKSYGFRTEKCLKIALYHALGDLPVPKLTHRFC